MIDPRALQQHFRNVHQKERPQKQDVPRVPDPVPLTAVQAIPVPVIEAQEEVVLPSPLVTNETITAKPEKEIVDLLINFPPPIDKIIINEIEEEIVETEKEDNEATIQDYKTNKTIEEYDPYGYYSGPKF